MVRKDADSAMKNSPTIITRRAVLRGLGVSLALPALESLTPVAARSAEAALPRRMLVIVNNIGVLVGRLTPTTAGRDYQPTPLLSILSEHRQDFTVFSGLSHPGVSGGHSTDNCFLTSARGAFKASFRNTISLDQLAADHIGHLTRYPSLNLGVNIEKANRSLSWTRDGVLLPAEDSAKALFQRLFVRGDQAAVEAQLRRLDERGSILDTLLAETRRYSRRISTADRSRLDQYLTSVREVETRLQTARQWESRPLPEPHPASARTPNGLSTTSEMPGEITEDRRFFEKFELMLRMAELAFESDSTRIVTLMLDAFRTPVFQVADQQKSTDSYHGLSHHGHDPVKVAQLEAADRRNMKILSDLIGRLAAKNEGNQRLLDQTMVLFGSNMGDANIHDNTNLPIILAGGGFDHGQHLAFRKDNNTPLSNLFVTMLQRLGIETDHFGSSTGSLTDPNKLKMRG